MIIFGRFSAWLLASLLVLMLTAAVAFEQPVFGAAVVAIIAILAIYRWRGQASR